MPTLHWIGKEKVINHHQEVPYRLLNQEYSYVDGKIQKTDSGTGNKIIHGDNLEALKSLLPEYEGRIKCIYIDPPYNTGNENWVYNDNVSHPKINKWLGEVVGREGEDLSRHDKWLCMMYPRLKLLQKLLSDDGAIFISIDDNELANLKLICDEIFGLNCFVANVSWQRTYSTRNDSKGVVNEVEHIIVYSKKINWSPKKLPRTEAMDAIYRSPDNDEKPWTSSSVTAPGAVTHQGMVYAIQHPFTGELLYPTVGRCWSLGQETMLENMNQWCLYELEDLKDSKKRAEICGIDENDIKADVKGIVLSEPLDISKKKAIEVLNRGKWPYFYFTNNGKGGLRRKTYLEDMEGRIITNFWPFSETGHTDEATKEVKSIFRGNIPFETPKPSRLTERVLQISTDQNSIILDSFAGSGTTAHALLNLNKEDGGNRKFILVEMEDYAETITAERVRRVIDGYGEGNSRVEGTGGGFDYYTLGAPLFLEGKYLNPDAPVDKIREYIFYTDTGQPMRTPEKRDNSYYLNNYNNTAWYFIYEKDRETTLDYDFLNTVQIRAEAYVIYADYCLLPVEYMKKHNITFKKIPRDISKI